MLVEEELSSLNFTHLDKPLKYLLKPKERFKEVPTSFLWRDKSYFHNIYVHEYVCICIWIFQVWHVECILFYIIDATPTVFLGFWVFHLSIWGIF